MIIINQEQKFNTVLDSLTDSINEQSFFKKFLELYPDDWKQLKITFSKFKRSNQFGKTIPLPKPEQALRKEIRSWLKKSR